GTGRRRGGSRNVSQPPRGVNGRAVVPASSYNVAPAHPNGVASTTRGSMRPHSAPIGSSLALTVLLAAFATAACAGRQEPMNRSTTEADRRPYLLETVGDFAVSRLYADGFDDLSREQRILAFYLYRAALAGRDIYYDQMGRDSLEVRDLLEEILTHPREVPRGTLQTLLEYLKLFWINNGNHLDRTKRK